MLGRCAVLTPRWGLIVGFCGYGEEPLCSMKGNFLIVVTLWFRRLYHGISLAGWVDS